MRLMKMNSLFIINYFGELDLDYLFIVFIVNFAAFITFDSHNQDHL